KLQLNYYHKTGKLRQQLQALATVLFWRLFTFTYRDDLTSLANLTPGQMAVLSKLLSNNDQRPTVFRDVMNAAGFAARFQTNRGKELGQRAMLKLLGLSPGSSRFPYCFVVKKNKLGAIADGEENE
ncbi:hypothetical protein CYMTET_34183, partial [Cymbomonas tetramitiformis]